MVKTVNCVDCLQELNVIKSGNEWICACSPECFQLNLHEKKIVQEERNAMKEDV